VPEIDREAIINTFCHRDYRDPDEVRIAIIRLRNAAPHFGSPRNARLTVTFPTPTEFAIVCIVTRAFTSINTANIKPKVKPKGERVPLRSTGRYPSVHAKVI
jgi:hypothetical protein